MNRAKIIKSIALCVCILLTSCIPSLTRKTENRSVPSTYQSNSTDTSNSAKVKWKVFFTDPYLIALIDSSLKNNQEFNIVQQEIIVAQNEVRARKGQYLPFLNLGTGAGIEKSARYTRNGAVDANTDIKAGKSIPDPLTDYGIGASVSWEVDIWRKLRNAKKSAMHRYFATVEGRRFLQTNLIAEIADSYYELMALDNQLEILKKNIVIQQNALEIVKLEKSSARVTELAVKRFEAEVLKNQSRQYYISQRIVETENRINFLVGRFPQPVLRNSQTFIQQIPDSVQEGIPSQLLENRPDIRQAEQELAATKINVKVAKANFYPTFMIMGGVGVQAFNPQYLLTTPESMLYNVAGELVGPVINRNAIKAEYLSANARQIQAIYNYERTILNAHIEVSNQMANMYNLSKSFELKDKQVQALTQSIDISTGLFKAARADYMEVLLTQRDALESKFELIETKRLQMISRVNFYQALGGGWDN